MGTTAAPDLAVSPLPPPLGTGAVAWFSWWFPSKQPLLPGFLSSGWQGMCLPRQQPSCVDNSICSSHLPRDKWPYLFCAKYLGKTHYSLLKELMIMFLRLKSKAFLGPNTDLKSLNSFTIPGKRTILVSDWRYLLDHCRH